MADETYRFVYDLNNKPFLKAMAEIDAAAAKTMGNLNKLGSVMKQLGQNPAGFKSFVGEAKKVEAAMKLLLTAASSTTAGLKTVGTGNSAVTSLTNRLKGLEAELKRVKADAEAAKASLAGVGSGVKLPGAGGAGAGGRAAGIGSHLAYSAFRRGVSAVGEASKDRKQFFKDAADLTSDYRKDLAELAVLKGKSTDDDAFLREDLKFQKDSLLNPQQSREFRLEFGGAVDASLKANGGRNLSPKVADDLEREAARFTARYNLDPTTGGRMAGLLGVTQRVPDAKTGVGIMAETMEQLNVAGVGSVKSLAAQMAKLSGGMLATINDDSEGGEGGGGGRFKSYPEMAARFAASTVNTFGNAAVAKTRIIQSDRLLRKFNGKEEEAFLRKVGITPEDDYEAAINKLAPHISGPDADHVLMSAGFGNSTERLAVIEEAKLNQTVAKNIADPRMAKARLDAIKQNREYGGTIVGQQKASENAEFAATVESGILGERLKGAQASARARMIDPNQPGGQQLKAKGSGVPADLYRNFVPGMFTGFSAEEQRVNEDAIRNLIAEGKTVGVDVAAKFPKLANNGVGPFNQQQYAEDLAQDFGQAAGQVEAAKKLKQAAGALNGAANALMRDGGNANWSGGDAPKQAGNGGAGVNPGRR